MPGARSALGVFAVLWLNLVLQPCAMAFGGDGECPSCPPEMDHSGMSHHGDARDSSSVDVPCATTSFDCALVDDYSHDGRGGQLKLKDVPNNTSVAIIETNIVLPNVPRLALRNFDRYRFAAPGAAPPLNVLYCVYLK
jgi:hypothetical protein